MNTKRSLPGYLLTVALVLFLICGFTVTPIAAAEIGYKYDIHTAPMSPELFKQYSEAAAAVASHGVAYKYKDLMTASVTPSPTQVTVTADDIINYLQTHPEVTEMQVEGEMYTADEVEYYLQNHPDFTASISSSLFSDEQPDLPVDPLGMYVTVTADDITDYLQTHPEFWGGSVDGRGFTRADIENYLQNHPDFQTNICILGTLVELLLGVAIVETAIMFVGTCITLAIEIVTGDVLLTAEIMNALLLFLSPLACATVGLVLCVAVALVCTAIAENGWEQVLILPVLFWIWSRQRKMQRKSPSAFDCRKNDPPDLLRY